MFKTYYQRINLYGVFVVFAALFLLTQSLSATAKEAAPEKVTVGMYVNHIYGFNLKENKFVADFYIWFKYEDDSFDPLKSFELKNGKIESITESGRHKDGGLNHVDARVIATVNEFWDVSKFPFDKHELEIEIEDGNRDETQLIYAADTENSNISDKAQVRGWKIDSFQPAVTTTRYKTNYGDAGVDTNKSEFSQFSFIIHASRIGYSQFFKLYSVLFFAVFVAFLTFFIYANSAPRFTLGASALVATAANSFVVSSLLPESNGFTLSDVFLISSLLLIFLSLVTSTISMNVIRGGNERQAQRIDRAGAFLFLIVFMSFFFWVMQQFD